MCEVLSVICHPVYRCLSNQMATRLVADHSESFEEPVDVVRLEGSKSRMLP